MGIADGEWVKAAMTDDAMVVELLVRLHKAPAPRARPRPRPQLPFLKNKAAAVPLDWSVRQRRSKSISVISNPRKPSHRARPTTQLSWSGAASFSGGSTCAGSEDSSLPMAVKVGSTARSKADINSSKITSKRSRKKTLPELRAEEISLTKERRDLKRELATLQKDLEKQRVTNENLKRMKVEVKSHFKPTSLTEESTSSQPHQEESTAVVDNVALESCPCPAETTNAATDSIFVVPDLNIPFHSTSLALPAFAESQLEQVHEMIQYTTV